MPKRSFHGFLYRSNTRLRLICARRPDYGCLTATVLGLRAEREYPVLPLPVSATVDPRRRAGR
jgi:hypothetical protein